MNYYILYNSISGNGKGKDAADKVAAQLGDSVIGMTDMLEITDYSVFLADKGDCALVICGGDGTLNRFVNDTHALDISCPIYYSPCGSGNDFLRDIGTSCENGPVEITRYLKDLPICEVEGKYYYVINGVGYGIDGYCCEVGEKMRAQKHNKINYTAIAVKGLLFFYKPTNATVTCDGEQYKFKKVWLSPIMNGRYYGGGMMPTPAQDRLDAEHKISALVFHRTGKIRTLMIFPSIFKGEHIKKKRVAKILSGNTITVEFAKPRTVQIDGEVISGVSRCTVYTCGTPEYAQAKAAMRA